MIGDNLETDILFGINSNITTLLVMTGTLHPPHSVPGSPLIFSCVVGVTNECHLSGEGKSETVPDYIVASMGDFAVLAEGK